jgi:hypothetical protein
VCIGGGVTDEVEQGMRDALVRSVRLCSGFLILVGLAGCGPLVLSVNDAVAMKGQPVPFSAYVNREHIFGLRSEIEHVPVSFVVDDRKIGENTADEEGRAAVMADHIEGTPATFQVRARVQGQTLDATGRIFHWQQGRVIVVVDIDHTISQTNYRKLLLKEHVDISSPIPGARETLNEIAKEYYILYLTARPRFLIEKTRAWLDHYSFPAGPVFTAPRVADAIGQLKFKQETLHEMRLRWPDVLIGIGNRTEDIEAYASSGMLPVIVYNGGEEEHYSDAVVLQDWQFVRSFFQANAQTLSQPVSLAKVIEGQQMILQPLIPYGAARSHYKPKVFQPEAAPAPVP